MDEEADGSFGVLLDESRRHVSLHVLLFGETSPTPTPGRFGGSPGDPWGDPIDWEMESLGSTMPVPSRSVRGYTRSGLLSVWRGKAVTALHQEGSTRQMKRQEPTPWPRKPASGVWKWPRRRKIHSTPPPPTNIPLHCPVLGWPVGRGNLGDFRDEWWGEGGSWWGKDRG
jgi:hypothetical protein